MVNVFKNSTHILTDAVLAWADDNVPSMGAAIAYYTVFSIAPLLIIAIAVAGLIFGEAATQGKVVDSFQGLVGQQGAAAIQEMIKNAHRPGAGILATIIGTVTLIIGASAVFSELQYSLNLIWGVKAKPGLALRTAVRQRFLSAAMIVGIAFLLLVSLLVTTALTAVGAFLSDSLPGGIVLWQVINFSLSLAITAALFGLIYKILPDVKIAWRDVTVGSLITAVLFTLGKLIIGLYLGNGGVTSVYGAAGSFVIVLIWVYYSSQVFLFGAEITKVYANRFGSHLVPTRGAIFIHPEADSFPQSKTG